MTDRAQSPIGRGHKRCSRLSGSLIAQLCVTAVLIGLTALTWASLTPRSALHFHLETGDALTRALVLFSLFCILAVACLVWLVRGVKMVLQRRADSWVPWVCLGAVGVFAIGLRAWREKYPPVLPILAADEPRYLKFATTTREQMDDKNGSRYLSLDPSYGDAPTPEEAAISGRLLPLVPDYWPRRFLSVYLEKDYVELSRGTGMLGRLGVRIYDRGPVAFRAIEELRNDPSLPRERRITDRLWFFQSD